MKLRFRILVLVRWDYKKRICLIPIIFEGLPIHFIGYDDLIQNKLSTGRMKDKVDARTLEKKAKKSKSKKKVRTADIMTHSLTIPRTTRPVSKSNTTV